MTNTGTAQSKTPAKSERIEVTPDQIQSRAYEIYESRGSAPGSDVEDWLQAERELSQPNPRQAQDPQQNQNRLQNSNSQQNSNPQQNPSPQQNQGPRPSNTNKPATRS